MIASVCIKDGKMHIYNEKRSFSDIGGIVFELGFPLLNFVCYEPEQFDDAFSMIAAVYDSDLAYSVLKDPEYIATLRELATELQKAEVYVNFYNQMLYEFILAFVDSPRKAIKQISEILPDAEDKLRWTIDFEWPVSSSPYIQVVYFDKERRLYRAALDVVALMSDNLKLAQKAMITEVELLIHLRENMSHIANSPMEYLYMLEILHKEESGHYFYIEQPFRAFYGMIKAPEIAELYEISNIKDLLRFEFIKMIEHDIFIKKCKNCGRFFIPRRRADAEYCERTYADTNRKCSEIGATLRYERKVAGNPILEAHKKAYRRFNSRTRAKKMTQTEFMAWSEEAGKKRDECLAGKLQYDEFIAWLEQGRIRKSRSK